MGKEAFPPSSPGEYPVVCVMHCAENQSDLGLLGLYQSNRRLLCLRIHLTPGRWELGVVFLVASAFGDR